MAGIPPGEAGSNELSGVVHGSAVQARIIYGDVNFTVSQPEPGRVALPAQLPIAVARFTGRSAELAGMRQAAAEYDPVRRLAVVVISGPGGVGKTALATQWLHRDSGRYEGGALYTDLHGQGVDRAATPGDVLTGFLSALGTRPNRIPVDLDDQAKLFRSLTSGSRMLVLLDNAATAAQVRALLPGPGPVPPPGQPGLPSLVVVTTRWRIAGLALDGARFIELGPLDDESGTELLTRMVGADRAAADTSAVQSVVRLCGGLPLAVCAAGARLVSHPRWAVGRIAAELATEQDRLTALTVTSDLSVTAVFDVSYQSLPTPTARLYRLLSLVPGPDFGPELAAAMAGLPAGQAWQLLDELTAASLLEETAEQRFKYHDLVRLHARGRARADSADEQETAISRAIGWYLTQAVAADKAIIPSRQWHLNPMYEQASAVFDGLSEALRWMESELPGLMAAVRAAHDAGLHEPAWQLCEALWGLLTYRKYFGYWIQSHLLGLDSAHACGDVRAEARLRDQLGLAYLNLGQHDQADEEFAQALALARQCEHRILEASALEHVGLTELSRGRPEPALVTFARARDLYAEIGARRGVMAITRHIGEAHRDAGRPEQAVGYLLDARRLAADLPDPYNEARCLTGLGQVYLQSGQLARAVDTLDEGLRIMMRLGAQYEQARIRAQLAGVLVRLDQAGQAREHLTAALAIYASAGAPEAEDLRRQLDEL
jgi:tetratricopeptide (TPR) repeat protein